MVRVKKNQRIIFFKKIKKNYYFINLYRNSIDTNNKKNLFFNITKTLFKSNLNIKFNLMFLNIFSFILNYILIKNKNSLSTNYQYYIFLKKNLNLNKWFLNFNSFFSWLLLNYELIFFFKKSPNSRISSGKKSKISFNFFFILKKKRKKIFFKWIKNKINFILKKKINFKILNLFLELILNFKKSNFFKFKNLIYKPILLK